MARGIESDDAKRELGVIELVGGSFGSEGNFDGLGRLRRTESGEAAGEGHHSGFGATDTGRKEMRIQKEFQAVVFRCEAAS